MIGGNMLLEYTLSDTIRYQKTPRFKSIGYITTGINFWKLWAFKCKTTNNIELDILRIMMFKHVESHKSFESISYLEEQYLPQSLSQMSDFKSRDKNDKQMSFSFFTLFKRSRIRKEIQRNERL